MRAVSLAAASALLVCLLPAAASAVTVNVTNDELNTVSAGSTCSLREAITMLDGATDGDGGFYGCDTNNLGLIEFDPALGDNAVITIETALPTITYPVVIDGSSIPDADGNGTHLTVMRSVLDTDIFRIFDIGEMTSFSERCDADSDPEVTIANLTLMGGAAPPGDPRGGGVSIDGTADVLLSNLLITDNSADAASGGNDPIDGWGGGVFINNSDSGESCAFTGEIRLIAISNSTISNNSATGGINASGTPGNGLGGGVYVAGSGGEVTITNSTISGNTATAAAAASSGEGGGIFANIVGDFDVTNTTVSGNTAATPAGGTPRAGGISLSPPSPAANGTYTITHSTVAFNLLDVGGSAGTSIGGIRQTNSANTVTVDATIITENTGSERTTAGGALNLINGSIDAPTGVGLGILADNGGPTQTHALLKGSIAFDAAVGSTQANDQRGADRGTIRDVGAFEAAAFIEDVADTSVDFGGTTAFSITAGDETVATSSPAFSVSCTNSTATGVLPCSAVSIVDGAGTNVFDVTLDPGTSVSNGTTTLTFTVQHGSETMTDTFVVTVNDNPATIGAFSDDCDTASAPFALDDVFVREDTTVFSDGNQGSTTDFSTNALSFGEVGQTSALFADPDDTSLTYSITYDGQTLASAGVDSWLVFTAPVGATPGSLTLTGGGPADGDVGAHTVVITGTDGDTQSASYTFTLHVLQVNDAPTAGTLTNQTTAEDTASDTYTIDVFGDEEEAGTELSYAAIEQGQAGLPSWLAFNNNPFDREFTATSPDNEDVGTVTIEVTATDSGMSGVQCSTTLQADPKFGTGTFTWEITNTNDPPEVGVNIPDMNTDEDAAFSYTVPFSGAAFDLGVSALDDRDRINVSETLSWTAFFGSSGGSGGTDITDCSSGCPWLTFNSTTREFSGTPLQADVGSVTVRVVLTDGSAASAFQEFVITVDNVDDDPVVAAAIPDQTTAEDAAWSFDFPTGTFTDEDVTAGIQTALTYAATLTDCPTTYDGNDDEVADGACPANIGAVPWLTNFPSGTTSRNFAGNPDNGDVGDWVFTITATDQDGGPTASTTLTLTVTNVNDAPVAGSGFSATTSQGVSLNTAVPSTVYSDDDSLHGDLLNLTLGGSAPGWLGLSESPPNSGNWLLVSTSTPTNDDVITNLSVPLLATDESGEPAASSVNILVTVNNVNDAPTVENQPTNDTVAEDSGAYTYTLAANTFDDIDLDTPAGAGADSFTYSAEFEASPNNWVPLSGQWLTFNAGGTGLGARTFTGTPGNDDVGVWNLRVTLTDSGPESVTTNEFTITVTNVNDAPTVDQGIANQNVDEDATETFSIPGDAFADIDPGPDVLTFTAQLASGDPLPSWLGLNGNTGVFTSTNPTNDDVGSYSIEVTADDNSTDPPSALTATTTFTLTVDNTNDNPTIENAVPDATVAEDSALNIDFGTTFGDVDIPYGDSLTYTAQLQGGGALPGWLTFDAGNTNFTGTPLNADVGVITVELTATDESAAFITDTFTITVTNTNDNPTVVGNGVEDLTDFPAGGNVDEDSTVQWTVALAFDDVDVTDTLAFTAVELGQSGLPGWLAFDGTTFTATPDNDDVGTYTIEVTANDQSAFPAGPGSSTPGTVVDTFDIEVVNVNDDPFVNSSIANQTATEDAAFTFQFLAETFLDDDFIHGDSLTYSATQVSGDPLPSWISFTGPTRTFSGTPLQADVGTLSVRVTATDTAGATAFDDFDIVIEDSQDDPTVPNPIENQTTDEDALWTFQFADDTFNDPDTGDSLTFSAQLEGGSPLPGWLSFQATNPREFTGTPTNDDVGVLSIEVTATDTSGGTATDVFQLTILNTNDAPTVENAIGTQNATEDSPFNFAVPGNTFGDVDVGDTLSYSALQADDSALPTWLNFAPATQTFSGTPTNGDVGSLSLKVIATDGSAATAEAPFTLVVANTNDAPTAPGTINNQTTNEDALFELTFADTVFNDVDAGDSLTYTAVEQGQTSLPGWLGFDGPTRTFSGTPLNADAEATYTIEVTATDLAGASATTSFSITVNNTNDPPTVDQGIADQSFDQGASTSFQFALDAFADDDLIHGDSLSYSTGSLPSWLSFNGGTRTFTITAPNNDQVGLSPFTVSVTAQDIAGSTATTTFDITIDNVNDAPTANGIADQNATEDSPFSFTVPGAAFSDIDIQYGDALTYTADQPSGDALPTWLSFNGTAFSGTPLNDDVGTLTVRVTATDLAGASTSTNFDIDVANTNDAPTVDQGIADQSVDEDQSTNIPVPANAFADVDIPYGDSLTYTAGLAVGGALPSWLTFDGSQFTALATNADVGTYDIAVTATDTEGATAITEFNLEVVNTNDTPTVANAIANQSVAEDSAFFFAVPGNTFDDVDFIHGDALSLSATLGDDSALPAWLNFNAATGEFDGVPTNDDVGVIAVKVTATDLAGASTSDTFDLTVTAVNDAPVLTLPGTQTGLEEAVITISGISVADVDAASDDIRVAISVGDGLLSIGTTTGLTFNQGDGSLDPSVSFDGTLAEVNAALGSLTYLGNNDFFGDDTLTINVDDLGNTGTPGPLTDSGTVTISVTNVNDQPSFDHLGNQNVDEDAGAQVIPNFAFNIDPGPNETEGTSFIVTASNNTLFAVQPSINVSGTLSYTPAPDANGSSLVTVSLLDFGGKDNGGQDTVTTQFTITVDPVNDPPVVVLGEDQASPEDSGPITVAGFVTSIDPGPADEASQTVSFAVSVDDAGLFAAVPAINSAGDLSYTPLPNAFGTATVTVSASDDGGTANGGNDTAADQTFLIDITPVNDAPSFSGGGNRNVLEDASVQIEAGWATDIVAGPDNEAGQGLSFFVVDNDNPSLFAIEPTLEADGTLTFQPAPDANGSATVSLVLADDGGTADGGNDTSAQQTLTINVTPVNDAPTFTKGGNQSVLEGAGLQTITGWATNVSPGPPDESAQSVTFSTSNNNTSLFATQPSVAPNGTLTYELAPGANGSATVTVTLSDNGGTANGGEDTSIPQTFTIGVGGVNDEPSFFGGPDQTVLEDAGLQVVPAWASGISAGPADESGQVLTFNVTTSNDALFSVLPEVDPLTGNLLYTPAANANGTAQVTVVLMDDGGTASGGDDTSDAYQFDINVTAVNDAPSFTKGPNQNLPEDAGAQTVTGWATNISAGPADEAGQTLTFQLSVDNLALFTVPPALSSTGTLTYTPSPSAIGTATVTLVLLDDGGTANGGIGTSSPQQFTITIAGVNDPPSFLAGEDQVVLEDGGAVTVANWATDISAGPADEAGQVLTFTTTNDNPGLFVVEPSVAGDGTLSYELAADVNGVATVSVTLMDDGGTASGGEDTFGPVDFTITVTPVNDAPSFDVGADQIAASVADPVAVPGWATNISAGPADEAGQGLTFTVTAANLSIFDVPPTVAPDGTLSFTPTAGAIGASAVTISLSDDGGTANGGVDTSAEQTFNISVGSANNPPFFTAGPDVVVAEDAGPQTIAWATGVDPGAPGESDQILTFNLDVDLPSLFVDGPAIAADGTLTFTSAPDATGTATISVTLSDNGGTGGGGSDTSEASVFTIDVTPVNDAPSFTSGGDVTVNEDAGAQAIPWATDISAGPGTEALLQSVNFNVSTDNTSLFTLEPALSPDGTLTFVPAPNASGTATVTVTLVDSGGTANGGTDQSAPQTFSVIIAGVNDPPSFTGGPNQDVLEDAGPQTLTGWASNISAGPADEAGQALTFVVTNDNAALFEVEPAISADGTLTYTTAADANGFANINVSLVDDGGGSDTSATDVFLINVTPVNDPPTFTPGSNVQLPQGSGAQTVTGWATNISPGPADESFQSVSFNVSVDNPGLFASPPAISPSGDLTFNLLDSTAENITVTVSATDSGGTAAGGDDTSDPVTFQILVGAVNCAPDFDPGEAQTTLEDSGPQIVPGWATNIDPGGGTCQEDFQSVSFIVTTDAPELFAEGPAVDQAGTLSYTPAPDAAGQAIVTVVAKDDGGSLAGGVDESVPYDIVLIITPVNDAPVFILGDDQSAPEGSGVQTTLAFAADISGGPDNESDQVVSFNVTTDNDGLFASAPAIAPDGTLTWEPGAISGSATVTVVAVDNGGTANGGVDTSEPQTFTITVTPVNNAPSFSAGEDVVELEDAGPVSLSGWASSISAGPGEGEQTVSFLVTTNTPSLFVAGPVVTPEGALEFTTATNANGDAVVTVVAQDDGGTDNGGVDASAPQSFTITILPVNDPPTVTLGDTINIAEDDPAQVLPQWATGIGPGAADEEGQTVVFELTADVEGAFTADPVLDLDGTLSFEVAPDWSGTITVSVVGMDDGGTDNGGVDTSEAQEFVIEVAPGEDAPFVVLPPDPDGGVLPFVTPEDTPLDLALVADDAEGATEFTWELLQGPANGTLEGELPNVTYTPDENYNGADSFLLTVSDGVLTSDPIEIPIDVEPVNDPPVITEPTDGSDFTALEGVEWTLQVTATDVDAGDEVSYSALGAPAGVLLDPATGELVWTPMPNQVGAYSFDLVASDLSGATDQVAINVTVSFVDADADGLPDSWEVDNGLDPTTNDSDDDNIDDFTEVAGDFTGPALDSDGDGTPDALDEDSDDDGIPDSVEAGDEDLATPPTDTDGDGDPDYIDEDSDDDSVPDAQDNCVTAANTSQANSDDDEQGDACDSDDDNDGIPDDVELQAGSNPTDSDSDDDTISDGDEYGADGNPVDTDGDGEIDAIDLDSDNDGVSDEVEAGDTDLGTAPIDTEGDGTPDFRDEDSDNDGIDDGSDNCRIEANPDQADEDGNGEGDNCDNDADGDGLLNADDNCPFVDNPDQADLDLDGDGDVCDSDDDDDGVTDENDNCPVDANPDQSDVDGDGDGDVCDEDFGRDPGTGGGCECNAGEGPKDSGLLIVLLLLPLMLWRRREG